MRPITKRSIIESLASERGVIRARDVEKLGISPRYLGDLVELGVLQKVERGTFTLAGHRPTEHHNLVMVAARAPNCVVSLLSALEFHGIGTQLPNSVWIAVPGTARPPAIVEISIEVVHMSPRSFNSGVDVHILEGIPVKVFSSAKTIADSFKFISSVGLDVCLESLRDALARNLVTRDDLFKYAQIDHVWKTMRPYMEALS